MSTLDELAATMESLREQVRADPSNEAAKAAYKEAVNAFEAARTADVEARTIASSDGDVVINPPTLEASAEAHEL